MKDDTRNYIVVGVFVIAMLVALIGWLALVSGRTGATEDYYILYDNVGSLSEGTEILYEGFPVGLIEDIAPVDVDGRRRFRVEVSVKRGWLIPDDSVATIYTSGLLSPAVIQIEGGASETGVEPGGQIPSTEATNVLAVVNDLAENSIKPLVETLGKSIPEILEQLDSFTAELNVTLGRVQDVLKPGNTQRLEQILVKLESTSENVETFTRDLRETQRRVGVVLDRVDELLDEEQGEVGVAAADLQHALESVARHIDAINANLESTTRNMDEFSRQVREDPSVIIRGRDAEEGAP